MVRRFAASIAALAFALGSATALFGSAPGALGATGSAAASSNVHATHAFLAAAYKLARTSNARTNAVQRKIKAYEQGLRKECPRAGAGSPQNSKGHKLSYEVVVALWSITYSSDAKPIAQFKHAIGKLKWSNHEIAQIASRYANSLYKLSRLPMPDLCADIASWKQSGFTTVPAHTLKLDAEAEAIELEPVPPHLLTRYEQSADKRVSREIARLEKKISESETLLGGNDWFDTLEILSLSE